MAIIQKRINQLDTYEQLLPGDAGYIAPTSIWLAVDYNGWSESKKMSLDDFLSTIHIEAGKLSNLASRSVAVVFGTAFSENTNDNINVYRESTPVAGKTIRETVITFDLSVTLTGFTLEIDPSEDLTGVIIDYQILGE